jgi:hypothetical protein
MARLNGDRSGRCPVKIVASLQITAHDSAASTAPITLRTCGWSVQR